MKKCDLFFRQNIRRHLKMKICDAIVVFINVRPDSHGMFLIAVKSPVYKLHLRNLVIQEKLKFLFHQIQISKPKAFIDRRQTVAAGKRTSPAGFIIDDFIFKFINILINERNFA